MDSSARRPQLTFKKPITLQELAKHKRLDPGFLQQFGLKDSPKGVLIPYKDENGKTVAERFRSALKAGFAWKQGDRLCPYGFWRLAEARKKGALLLVEGESDAWTCWHHGNHALGLPGASTARLLEAEHLQGISRLYVFQEPDSGGACFVKGIARRLKEINFTGEAKSISLPGFKDVSELHVQLGGDHGKFEAALREAVKNARPLPEPEDPGDEDPDGDAGIPGDPKLLCYQPPPIEVLPPALRDFVEAGTEAFLCDSAFLLLPVLAATAAAIGALNRTRLLGSWQEPCILRTCTVSPSGSGKTPPLFAAVAPLHEIEETLNTKNEETAKAFEEERQKYESDLAAWKKKAGFRDSIPQKPREPPASRLVVNDVTIEALGPVLADNPRGVILVRDELSGWLQSLDCYRGGRGGDSSKWDELFHARPIMVDRKSGTPKTIRIPRGGVSATGGLQPGSLKRLMTPELLESGFMARILFAYPPAAPSEKWPREIPAHNKLRYHETIRRLRDLPVAVDSNGKPAPTDFPLSPEAEAAFRAWKREFARERRQLDEESSLNAAAAKIEACTARLALVLHLARWAETGAEEPGPISRWAVEGAIALGKWFWREARRFYGALLEGIEVLSPRLLTLTRWLERQGGGVAPWEVAKSGPRPYRGDTETVERDLRDLVKVGLVEELRFSSPDGKGRPSGLAFRLRQVSRERKIEDFGAKADFPLPSHEGNGKTRDGEEVSPVASPCEKNSLSESEEVLL